MSTPRNTRIIFGLMPESVCKENCRTRFWCTCNFFSNMNPTTKVLKEVNPDEDSRIKR